MRKTNKNYIFIKIEDKNKILKNISYGLTIQVKKLLKIDLLDHCTLNLLKKYLVV